MKNIKIIGISGGSGSGKTTLANKLCEELGLENTAIIHQDSYYYDQSHLLPEERNKLNFDSLDSIDFKLLFFHISELKNNRSIDRPNYCFTDHTRMAKTTRIEPKNFIIVDGILIFAYLPLIPLFDLKIFIDIAPDIRIIRRILRDCSERGRTVESVITQYLESVKPMYEKHVYPIIKKADIVFENNNVVEQLLTIKNNIL